MEAKCRGWTKYYGGEILRVNSDGTYDIKFDDGERKRGVEADRIKGGSGGDDDRSSSSSRPALREGDRVEAKCKGWTKYYGGEILRVNSEIASDTSREGGEITGVAEA